MVGLNPDFGKTSKQPLTMAGIKILHWNARGLLAHCQELKHLVAAKRYDVLCIQESFLKPTHTYCLAGYNEVRKDRVSRNAGGVVTYVRQGLKYAVLDRPEAIEGAIIRLATPNRQLVICNVYLPPGSGLSDEAKAVFGRLFEYDDCIIVGDLNARSVLWGSQTTDSRGDMIEQLITVHDYVALNNGQPTRFGGPNGTESHLDVSLATHRLAMKCRWSLLNDTMGSDHCPVLVTVDEAPCRESSNVPKWRLAKADVLQDKVRGKRYC